MRKPRPAVHLSNVSRAPESKVVLWKDTQSTRASEPEAGVPASYIRSYPIYVPFHAIGRRCTVVWSMNDDSSGGQDTKQDSIRTPSSEPLSPAPPQRRKRNRSRDTCDSRVGGTVPSKRTKTEKSSTKTRQKGKRALPNTCCFVTYLRRVRFVRVPGESHCTTCRHGSPEHCSRFPAFLQMFRDRGITECMSSFLPNWKDWVSARLEKIKETPRVLAALQMLKETYQDDTDQVKKTARISLEYMIVKYRSPQPKKDRRSIRWMHYVARKLPLRQCRVVCASGKQCRHRGVGFGNHSRGCFSG